ncbi:MAG: phospholipase D-like domain-containing protein [Patescibacteria group bacterium]
MKDLRGCKKEVIIESPYITSKRMRQITPIFISLVKNGVSVYIITRNPEEHDEILAKQAEAEIQKFENIGVQTLLCVGNHHRKLAIIDRTILWEGSLNILSQTRSREIMRRIQGSELATEAFNFLNMNKFI